MKKFLITLMLGLFCFACSNAGTETSNVPSTITLPRIETTYFDFQISLLENWDYEIYSATNTPGDEAFAYSRANTETVANFTKTDLGIFTIFASTLETDESFSDFVVSIHSDVTPEITSATAEGVTAYATTVYSSDPGPHGGYLFDFYMNIGADILWMRAEVMGTDEEKQQTLDEFADMIETITITDK